MATKPLLLTTRRYR